MLARTTIAALTAVSLTLGLRLPAETQTAVRVKKDVEYLEASRAEKCDLYLPPQAPGGKRFPAVVIIHGGGFTGGDKGAKREQNIGNTLALNGYVGMSINYLLAAPGKPAWPQNVHDCKTAVRWLRKNATRLNVDPDRIGAIGGSAGGHLASMLALAGPDAKLDPPAPYGEFSTRVKCAVDLYGPAELVRDHSMFGRSRAEAPELYRQASPVTHATSDDPPMLLLHGTADTTVPVAQSEQLAAALKKAGIQHELIIVEGAPHSFHLEPKQRDLRPAVLGFFDRHLKSKP
jgi:acetyl esterase/lipase